MTVLGYYYRQGCIIAFLILINARSCSLVQFSFGPFMLFFVDNKGLRGVVNSDRFGINVIIWCMLSMNDLSCFSVCGWSISEMDFVFLSVGIIPWEVFEEKVWEIFKNIVCYFLLFRFDAVNDFLTLLCL